MKENKAWITIVIYSILNISLWYLIGVCTELSASPVEWTKLTRGLMTYGIVLFETAIVITYSVDVKE
jgi:hypothetical protein